MSYNEDPKYSQNGYNQGYNPNGYNQGYNPNGYNNGGGMPPKPNNYLVFSILVTIFCCIPTGIVAIVYSTQTDSAYNAGNYNAAVANSNKAKTWCIVSLALGVAEVILYAIFYGAFVLAALSEM